MRYEKVKNFFKIQKWLEGTENAQEILSDQDSPIFHLINSKIETVESAFSYIRKVENLRVIKFCCNN